MKWFDKWFYKQAKKVWDNKEKYEEDRKYTLSAKEKYALGTSINLVGAQARAPSGSSELESHPDLNFRMFRAENGYAMEVRRYDKRVDRHSIALHLITDEQDLGQAISHIITVESLKAQ